MFTDNDDTQVVGFFGMFPGDLKEAYRLSVDRLGPAVRFGIVDDPELVRVNRQFEDRVVLFRWDFISIAYSSLISKIKFVQAEFFVVPF